MLGVPEGAQEWGTQVVRLRHSPFTSWATRHSFTAHAEGSFFLLSALLNRLKDESALPWTSGPKFIKSIPYLLFALTDMGLFPFLKEARVQWVQNHHLDETEVYFKKPGLRKPCRTAFFSLTRRRGADPERKEGEGREITGSKNFTFSEVLSKEPLNVWATNTFLHE